MHIFYLPLIFFLKNCTNVLKALTNGDFGECKSEIEIFTNKCHKLFPYTAIFKPSTSSAPSENNHLPPDQENCNSN